MAEFKKSSEAKDYKEPFEFRMTVGDNIICQRYFRINSFNPTCLRSYELVGAIRNCANTIDRDLRQKTQVYLEIFAPRYFDSVEQMNDYFSVKSHCDMMHLGEGIVVRGNSVDYFWDGEKPSACSYKFDDGDLCNGLTDEDHVQYKFAFLINGEEICSTIWDGVYPKYIRNSIDLSNKRGKFDGEDLTKLSFEQYLLYKLVENRTDLVWGIIKEICTACSIEDSIEYHVFDVYGKKKYENKDLHRMINPSEYDKKRTYRPKNDSEKVVDSESPNGNR